LAGKSVLNSGKKQKVVLQLRDTLHTKKFKAAWDKVKGSIKQLKEKVI
jgi:hypothetical protein